MRKQNHFAFCLPLVLAILTIFSACLKTPEEKFENCLKKAAAGQPKAAQQLEELLLAAATVETFANGEIYGDGKILWKKNGSSINMLYPKNSKFNMQNENMNMMRAVDTANAVFCDGNDIFIFDLNGKFKKKITIGTDSNPVQALTASDGIIYYCQKNKIYQISETDETGVLFVKDTFNPPYTRLFNTSMYTDGKKLGLLLGVAGLYYFNVVDINKKKTVNTRIRMSSANLYLQENSVLYISGDTGNWALSRFYFNSTPKKLHQRYKEIYNVEIFPNELIIENGNGIYIGSSGKEDIELPNAYTFKGRCGKLALIKYGDSFYGVDTGKLYTLLTKTKQVMPDFFN